MKIFVIPKNVISLVDNSFTYFSHKIVQYDNDWYIYTDCQCELPAISKRYTYCYNKPKYEV